MRTTEAKAFVGSEAHPTSQNYTSTGLRSQRLVDVLCVHVADQPDTIAWQLACSSCSNSPVIYSGRLRRQHATQACVACCLLRRPEYITGELLQEEQASCQAIVSGWSATWTQSTSTSR